jgi:uncharacterized lipoprotein YbaY
MFRLLPIFGSDPRATAEIVNGIMNGKTNNHGTVTLATGNATTTTIVDERISPDTKIVLVPFSDAAEADSAPYGAFQDSTDQTAGSTTIAYSVTFDTTDYSNGVYLSNSSRVNVRNYGIYNLQFSIQFKNTTNDTQDVDVWFSKNGTNIDKSNSRFGLPPRKSSGDPSHLIAALNFYVELQARDYVELKWRTSDTGVSIEQYGTSTSPTRPTVPSAIFTAQYVAPSASTNVYVSAQTKGSATLTHFANSTSDKTYAYILVG